MAQRKLQCIVVAACAIWSENVHAATVTFDGAGIRTLREAAGGSLVVVGSTIRIGYFANLTDAAIIAAQDNSSFLNDHFVPFSVGGAVGDGVGGAAGSFTFDTTATVEQPNGSFPPPTAPNNNQIYIWTFDSSNSPSDASQQAIFSSSLPSWRWPVTDDGFTDRSISLDDSLSMLVGGFDAAAVYLHPIPEAGAAALLVFGTGILAVRRSRPRV